MPVNFDSALMRSKAIASLDHASFRVYFVLSQHCVELRSTRIATPSFTQLHSAIAPECGGISIGMFRKSLLALESAGFLRIQTQGRVKIFDILGVRESYPDVPWFDRPVLILEAAAGPEPVEGAEGPEPARGPELVEGVEGAEGVSPSPPAHDSSIINHHSSMSATPPASSSADGNADVVGSSSETPGLQSPDPGRASPILNHQSAFINARKAPLPVAEQKALLDDLRKRTAAVLARVHRDFPQSRPVRWGSQDPSSPFEEEKADIPASASDGSCPETPGQQPEQSPPAGGASECPSPIINPQSSIRPNPEPVEGIINSPDAPILWNAFDVPTVDLATVDEDLLKNPTGQYAIHLRNCGKLPPLSESSRPARLSA